MPSNESVNVLSTAITVFTGGTFAAAVTYFLNEISKRREFIKKKAEELYSNFDEWAGGLGRGFILHYPLIEGKITYREFQDLQLKQDLSGMGEAHRKVRMITDIYFPELRPQLEEVFRVRSNINSIIADHKRAYQSGFADPAEWFPKFHEATAEITPAEEGFRQAIVKMAVKRPSIQHKRQALS